MTLFDDRGGFTALASDEDVRGPAHTPDQAEGEDTESGGRSREDDALWRDRPSQAEGEPSDDEAGEAPRED